MGRVILAFLLGPALFPVMSLAFGSVWSGVELVLVISYASTLLFGLPLFFLFKWRRWLKWWQVTLGAATCAMPFAALMADLSNPRLHHLTNSLLLVGTAAIAGLFFWIIGLAGNCAMTHPDR